MVSPVEVRDESETRVWVALTLVLFCSFYGAQHVMQQRVIACASYGSPDA